MSARASFDVACVDGTLVPSSQASIPVTDDGLLRGDGVFEVLRLYGGVPFARAAHLERLARSARNLRLELDPARVADDLDALLAATGPADALLRVLLTRGGHRIALIEPLPVRPATLSLGCVTFAPTRALDGVKSLSYAANMLAGRLARERGFDEALLSSPHGRILELPTASFFWAKDGRLHTPPLSDHILDSITRQLVVECCDATETATTLSDIAAADEAFVASTVVEVKPVNRVEQHELTPNGPITRAAAERVRVRIEEQLARG